MIICLDLDDVLVDLIGELLTIYNKKYETNVTREDIHTWSFFPQEVHKEFHHSRGYRRLEPIPGARELFSWLKTIGNVPIVTIRPEEFEQDTYFNLEQNFPSMYKDGVYFTDGPKTDTLLGLEADILIDDSVNHTQQAAENRVYTILYNNGTPMYSRAEDISRRYKADDMKEIRKHVLNIREIKRKF